MKARPPAWLLVGTLTVLHAVLIQLSAAYGGVAFLIVAAPVFAIGSLLGASTTTSFEQAMGKLDRWVSPILWIEGGILLATAALLFWRSRRHGVVPSARPRG